MSRPKAKAPGKLFIDDVIGGIRDGIDDVIDDVEDWFMNNCEGKLNNYGNHVGDWEHITIRFKRGVPYKMYLSTHDFGTELEWGLSSTWHSGDHPIIFSAKGSHGMWAQPGAHDYTPNKVMDLLGAQLIDECATGTEWNTWEHLWVRKFGGSYDGNTEWLNYEGRWGNLERDCKKVDTATWCVKGECLDWLDFLDFEFCKLESGPSGPLQKDAMDPNMWEMV